MYSFSEMFEYDSVKNKFILTIHKSYEFIAPSVNDSIYNVDYFSLVRTTITLT